MDAKTQVQTLQDERYIQLVKFKITKYETDVAEETSIEGN